MIDKVQAAHRIKVLHGKGMGESPISSILKKEGISPSSPYSIRPIITAILHGTFDEYILLLGQEEENAAKRSIRNKARIKSTSHPENIFTVAEDTEAGRLLFTYVGDPITDIPQLLEQCKVDLTKWKIAEQHCKSWSGHMKISPDGKIEITHKVTNISLSVKLILAEKENALRDLVAQLLEDLDKKAPHYPTFKWSKKKEPHLLEIAIVDTHIGANILSYQTGGNWTPQDAADSVPWATQALVHRAGEMEIERVVFVMGNDHLHYDNFAKTTTSTRHVMPDTHIEFNTAFKLAKDSITQSVDWLIDNVAPVDVVIVPGNHDANSTMALGECLKSHYRHTPDAVRFIESPHPRRYIQYGVNLIGFAHGHVGKPERSVLAMPQEVMEAWASSRVQEIHHGHFHTIRTHDIGGIICRFLPSLCPATHWATKQGFLSQLGAYGFAYHREHGQVARFSTPLRDIKPLRKVLTVL